MVYLFNINSIYLQKEEISKIVKEENNIITFNNEDTKIDEIIMECSYYSFIDSSKVIIVNNFKLIEENKEILKYIDNPNKDVKLILISNNLDKRSKLYKEIKDKVNYIEIKELKNNDLINKIDSYCKKNKIKIDYKSMNYLLENNLNNLDLVITEIDKLNIISSNINEETLKKYASRIIPDESFELCDAIVEKKTKIINELITDFIETKKEVIPFIALLAMQYRYIYACKVTKKSPDHLAKLFGVRSDYPFKKASTRQNLYSLKELENILTLLANIDIDLKSTDKDQYSLLRNFITNIL